MGRARCCGRFMGRWNGGWSVVEKRGVKGVGLQREFLELRKLADIWLRYPPGRPAGWRVGSRERFHIKEIFVPTPAKGLVKVRA